MEIDDDIYEEEENEEIEEISEMEIDDDIYENEEFCFCDFCIEFRNYHYPREESIEDIILSVLNNINNQI